MINYKDGGMTVIITSRTATTARWALAFFLLGGMGLVLVTVALSLGSATITLYPRVTSSAVKVHISIDAGKAEANFPRNILRGKILSREISDTRHFPARGESVQVGFARGEVEISNAGKNPQPLLPRTHLRDTRTGIYVLTDRRVVVPAGGSVQVGVTAEKPGAAGNLPPTTFEIDRLRPALRRLITARSDKPLQGGERREKLVTVEDVRRAEEEMRTALLRKAREAWQQELGNELKVPDEAIHISWREKKAEPPAGSVAPAFTFHGRAEITALVFEEADLLQLTLMRLKEKAGDNQEFLDYQPDSFRWRILKVNPLLGKATLEAELSGRFSTKLSAQALAKEKLVGLTAREVEQFYAGFPEIARTEISLSPPWLKKIPARPSRITIRVTTASPKQ
jgi:hypothetical protein